MLKHPDKPSIGTRVDSGNIAEQCVNQYFRMRAAGLSPRRIVFEDEVTPETARAVFAQFRDKTGLKPDMLFPGAGGYWWRNVHRDEISMGYKRSQTRGRPNCKFSNSPGKESIAGAVRVYAQGSTLVIADRSETIDGEPLYVQLVRQGRIVYNEWFEQQAERADATWGNYKKIVLSPLVAHYKMVLGEKRRNEIAAAKKRHAAAA
jgi:nicotinic acid phosphoribosyltransferase